MGEFWHVTDLLFPVRGETLTWDHSYALFGALCRRQPRLHRGLYPLGVFPINGVAGGARTLRLTEQSVLRLRLPAAHFGDIFPLIGAELELDSCRLTLDTPRPVEVRAASRLFSPWVTFAGAADPDVFLERLESSLQKLEVTARFSLAHPAQSQAGDGSLKTSIRRTRCIKGQSVVGYAVLLEDLSAEHSLQICTQGLGGRRHFGGGLFLPARDGR